MDTPIWFCLVEWEVVKNYSICHILDAVPTTLEQTQEVFLKFTQRMGINPRLQTMCFARNPEKSPIDEFLKKYITHGQALDTWPCVM